jgi:ParB family transcriptional regulator, chromosome partitioning protein
MGRRVNLAQLAGEPILDATVPQLLAAPAARMMQVPLHAVAANPVNPRVELGDLSDLESMRSVGQLQPCVVVTRAAFTAIYPEHTEALNSTDYVIVAGSRRRLAAEKYDLPTLDIVIKDILAADRATFYGASVSENIDRRNFDPLEEARAIEHLIQECGSGTTAAEMLGKSKGWVSQRLALLKLSPDMQNLLRSGDLPIRDARRLAALPEAEQRSAWEQERVFTAVNAAAAVPDGQPASKAGPAEGEDGQAPSPKADRKTALRIPTHATVDQVAAALRAHLTQAELHELVEVLIRTT